MVEVIVSIGVASMVVLGFTYLNFQNIRISQHNILNLQANLYAMEALEIAKELEISDWDEFDECSTKCHPRIDGGFWELASGEEGIGGEGVFTRWMAVEDHTDPELLGDSKKVTVFVTFSDGLGDHEIKVETYVFDINQI